MNIWGRWGPFIHAFLYQIFRCRSRPVLAKGHEIQYILQEALCAPKRADAIADETTAGLAFKYPSSYCECRHAKGSTTRVSQGMQHKPDFSRSCRLKRRRDWNRRFDGRCAKGKKHNPSIHVRMAMRLHPHRGTRLTFPPRKIIFVFVSRFMTIGTRHIFTGVIGINMGFNPCQKVSALASQPSFRKLDRNSIPSCPTLRDCPGSFLTNFRATGRLVTTERMTTATGAYGSWIFTTAPWKAARGSDNWGSAGSWERMQ